MGCCASEPIDARQVEVSSAKQHCPEVTLKPGQSAVDALVELYPHWDQGALEDVLHEVGGDVNLAARTIHTWSYDDSGSRRSQWDHSTCTQTRLQRLGIRRTGEPPRLPPRPIYEAVLTRLLDRKCSPGGAQVLMAAHGKFLARAKLAKEVVACREGKPAASGTDSKRSRMVMRMANLRKGSATHKEKCEEARRRQMTREAQIMEGRALLTKRLLAIKARELEMKDDGNCQFRALAFEIYGDEELHSWVRKIVVEYLKLHAETYSAFVGDNKEWKAYLRLMSKTRTWGDELTLRAAVEAYQVQLYVVSSEKENWLIKYEPDDKQFGRICFITYVSPIHYNVCMLLGLNSSEHCQ